MGRRKAATGPRSTAASGTARPEVECAFARADCDDPRLESCLVAVRVDPSTRTCRYTVAIGGGTYGGRRALAPGASALQLADREITARLTPSLPDGTPMRWTVVVAPVPPSVYRRVFDDPPSAAELGRQEGAWHRVVDVAGSTSR